LFLGAALLAAALGGAVPAKAAAALSASDRMPAASAVARF
jgi:hypothetical protein